VNIHPEYKEFLRLLIEEKVEFLLIGGFAVAHHGYIRTTQDIDFFFRNTPVQIHRVLRVLDRFGIDIETMERDRVAQPGNILRIGVKPVRIELLNQISGVAFEEAWNGRTEVNMDGLSVPVIGLKELLANKLASGRLKDLADHEELGGSSDS